MIAFCYYDILSVEIITKNYKKIFIIIIKIDEV